MVDNFVIDKKVDFIIEKNNGIIFSIDKKIFNIDILFEEQINASLILKINEENIEEVLFHGSVSEVFRVYEKYIHILKNKMNFKRKIAAYVLGLCSGVFLIAGAYIIHYNFFERYDQQLAPLVSSTINANEDLKKDNQIDFGLSEEDKKIMSTFGLSPDKKEHVKIYKDIIVPNKSYIERDKQIYSIPTTNSNLPLDSNKESGGIDIPNDLVVNPPDFPKVNEIIKDDQSKLEESKVDSINAQADLEKNAASILEKKDNNLQSVDPVVSTNEADNAFDRLKNNRVENITIQDIKNLEKNKPESSTNNNDFEKDKISAKNSIDNLVKSGATVEQLQGILSQLSTLSQIDPKNVSASMLKDLPPEIVGELVKKGLISSVDGKIMSTTLNIKSDDQNNTNTNVDENPEDIKVITLPDDMMKKYVSNYGIYTIPQTDIWALNGGVISLPLPGGGDIRTVDDFKKFGLKP